MTLPYRLNVGAVLFNHAGQVFIGRRAGMPAELGHVWQFPQGGIDPGEDPATAVMRELAEEIGTARAQIVAEYKEWLTYDLPPHLIRQAFGGQFRGQRQRWFALRFHGTDADINLNAHIPPEFEDWRWADLAETPALAVDFKRPIYATIAAAFAGVGLGLGK